MFKFKFWKFLAIFLSVLLVLMIRAYLNEAKRNEPYKQQLANLEKFLSRSKEEVYDLQKKIISQRDEMNQEKEIKDKLGQALEGEKMIIVSEEVLRSINLPINFK
ncbi:MAG: hypothetical protein NZ822_00435 [Patescibacteria group bacterium]|nr:hypothetical protein [Patescibacteria group bacterium]